jgi:hypothetical protein
MAIFMALGAPRGMTTLLKITSLFSIRGGDRQFMSYCWRSHSRNGQHGETPGFGRPATHESCVFETSPAVSKATMSQDVLASFARDMGLARVRLGHILAAVGLNVLRLGAWFLETARANTRITPFARLVAGSTGA